MARARGYLNHDPNAVCFAVRYVEYPIAVNEHALRPIPHVPDADSWGKFSVGRRRSERRRGDVRITLRSHVLHHPPTCQTTLAMMRLVNLPLSAVVPQLKGLALSQLKWPRCTRVNLSILGPAVLNASLNPRHSSVVSIGGHFP
jgi:hypothetical protein